MSRLSSAMVERQVEALCVGGSIPSDGTILEELRVGGATPSGGTIS